MESTPTNSARSISHTSNGGDASATRPAQGYQPSLASPLPSSQLLRSPISNVAAREDLMEFQMGLVRSKLRTRTEAEEASSRAIQADLALASASPAVARAVVGGAITSPAIESDRQKLLKTVAQANSALSDRNSKVATAERELTQFSTVCLRSTTRAEDRVASHEVALKRSQGEKQRQAKLLEDLTTELINARRGLSQYQIAIEEDRKALDEARVAVADAKGKEQAIEAATQGMKAAALEEQRQGELNLRSLQDRLQQLHQSMVRVGHVGSEERAAHNSSVVAARSQVAGLRRQQSEAKETIHALRRALQDATLVEEESARRFNKKEAELDEEAQMEKRIAIQDVSTAHDEAMRDFRTRSEQQHEHLRTRADALRLELATAEKELLVVSGQQTQLLGGIQIEQTQLSSLAQVHSRSSAAEETLRALSVEVKEQEEQLGDYNAVLAATNDRLAVLRDTVAPMDDIAGSIALMRAQVDERRSLLGDAQAQHSIQSASRDESLKAINQARLAAEKSIAAKYSAIAESKEDTAQTAEAIKSQLRVLEVETSTMEDNIRSLTHRNQTLVASLDEIERHRNALEETILRQKEEARRAAHALLVQLEGR